MTLIGIAIAGLQYAKIPVALLYAGLGIANLIVVVLERLVSPWARERDAGG